MSESRAAWAEFFDFLLGWFGLDLAGDDRPLAKAGG